MSVFGRRGARPLNFNEILRMYTIGGRLFTVPDIQDRDIKNNGDIRRMYGAPRTMDAAENKSAKTSERRTIGTLPECKC